SSGACSASPPSTTWSASATSPSPTAPSEASMPHLPPNSGHDHVSAPPPYLPQPWHGGRPCDTCLLYAGVRQGRDRHDLQFRLRPGGNDDRRGRHGDVRQW